MTIHIEYETEKVLGIDYEEIANRVAEAVLDYEKCPYEAEVNLLLTDDAAIHEINLECRGMDAPTDVLSFPTAEYGQPSDFHSLEQWTDGFPPFHPETGELMLGDIVISVEKVIEQAREYGHGKEREFGFLIVHSMLHLLGYDHEEEEERIQMEAKQREILREVHLER